MKMLGATAQQKKLFLRLQLDNPTKSRRIFRVACSDKRGKRQQKLVSVDAGASAKFLLPLEGLFGELNCGFQGAAARGAGGSAKPTAGGKPGTDRTPPSAPASQPQSAPASQPQSAPASQPASAPAKTK